MKVEVSHVDKTTGETKWYPGKISSVRKRDKKVDVTYTDGTDETDLPMNDRQKVRALGTQGTVGGVLFLDEAYDLDPANNPIGRAIMAEIMSAAEDHRDTVTIILAGYKTDIENKLYAYNSGMASRFIDIQFDDFTVDQLENIWNDLCAEKGWKQEKKHNEAKSKVSLVASRRVARGMGTKTFGNARSVRKLFESAVSQAKLRYLDENDSETTITIEDVIGKEPTEENIPELASALRDLDAKIGLTKVKGAVRELIDLARNNYRKELNGEKIDHVALNRMFLGNPGTGKTTIASIYGRILKALRLLTKGEVVKKTASDFVGDVIGATQNKTRGILEMAQGKVLLIDEAYNLDDDMYGKQALDTIVEKVMGAPGEDIAVIMCGYEAPMKKMMRDQNPGLARRFDVRYALYFDDFSNKELLQIMSATCIKDNIYAPIDVKLLAIREISKRRALPNFGNAGAVLTMLSDARRKMAKRRMECRDDGPKDAHGARCDW